MVEVWKCGSEMNECLIPRGKEVGGNGLPIYNEFQRKSTSLPHTPLHGEHGEHHDDGGGTNWPV
jgi:hypothetical protein